VSIRQQGATPALTLHLSATVPTVRLLRKRAEEKPHRGRVIQSTPPLTTPHHIVRGRRGGHSIKRECGYRWLIGFLSSSIGYVILAT
jgi:hypothetical protein